MALIYKELVGFGLTTLSKPNTTIEFPLQRCCGDTEDNW